MIATIVLILLHGISASLPAFRNKLDVFTTVYVARPENLPKLLVQHYGNLLRAFNFITAAIVVGCSAEEWETGCSGASCPFGNRRMDSGLGAGGRLVLFGFAGRGGRERVSQGWPHVASPKSRGTTTWIKH